MKQSRSARSAPAYETVVTEIVALIDVARRRAARAVNATMTAVYWSIGRRIVLEEQGGARRAEYGEGLIEQLSQRLTAKFGRGFGPVNLWQMRAFYLSYAGILQTASEESGGTRTTILQRASGESDLLGFVSAKLPRFDVLVAAFHDSDGSGTMVPGSGFAVLGLDTSSYAMIADQQAPPGSYEATARLPGTTMDACWVASVLALRAR